jgi:hypothetical protein
MVVGEVVELTAWEKGKSGVVTMSYTFGSARTKTEEAPGKVFVQLSLWYRNSCMGTCMACANQGQISPSSQYVAVSKERE